MACLLTQLGEELPQHTHEVAQGQSMVGYYTLYLVELSQVGGVQRLIPEHTINGEVLGWCEGFLERRGDSQMRPDPGTGQKVDRTIPTTHPAQAKLYLLR